METPRFFQFPLTHPAHTTPEHGPERYNFGPFTLDVERHLLTGAGLPIALQPKSFDLLCLFLKSNGAVLPKDQLMRALWPDTFVEEANLSNLIALLRKLLGDSPSRSQYIQTVPKVGYRFAAPVNAETRTFDAPSAPPAPQPQTGIRIIVFPFRVNTGVPDQEHLAYSLPEAISSSLAELNAFTVRSMQSAMRFDPVRWIPERSGVMRKLSTFWPGPSHRATPASPSQRSLSGLRMEPWCGRSSGKSMKPMLRWFIMPYFIT
jgi:DNA-binding winged helix-turn-helix (wHTH) protein